MARVVAAALLTALASALVAAWLSRELPPAAVPALAPPPVAPVAVTAPAPVVTQPPAPAKPRAAKKKSAPVDEPLVSLEDLMRLPEPRATAHDSLDWPDEKTVPSGAEAPARRKVHVDFSQKKILEDVPTQPKRRQTDVGVSVSVDEGDKVRLRGGVRVDEREGERTEAERDRETTPSFGVEVRF